jgi:hypothetical protein
VAELLLESSSLSDNQIFETKLIDVDPKDAYERGRIDFNFFASLMIPDVIVYLFPDFYVGLFKILTTRDAVLAGKILRFALGLPRGHAKTTFIKIIIAYLIVYDMMSFIVIICATSPLAQELLSDVNDMLCSDNAKLVYGDWDRQLSTDNKELKKCQYHNRSVILAAKGADTAIRGINIKHRRPDVIFCDDAQTKENDESPTDRLKFRKWLVAMFKIIAPRSNRLIIYVGNMYSEDCILFQLKNNPSWISLITGAIKENGEPLWPELHSIDELMESYFHDEAMGEADVWFAEVMNDPISRAISLLLDSLPELEKEEEDIVPDGVFLTIDPAGFRDNSDDNVIVVHYVFDGKGMVAELDAGIKDPEQIIIRALQLCMHHGGSLIGIEETGYQQTLLFWIRKYINEWGITGIQVVPLKPAGRSKEARIRLFIAELYAMNYYLFAAVRSAFTWQAMKYKIGKKKNKDDILDAVAYGLDVRTEYWDLIRNLKAQGKWSVQATVLGNNTPF